MPKCCGIISSKIIKPELRIKLLSVTRLNGNIVPRLVSVRKVAGCEKG